MNSKWKRLLAAGLCLCTVLTAACGKNGGDSGTTGAGGNGGGSENAMGRYIEQELNFPEELTQVYSVDRLDDGTLRLVADEGIYLSADGGESWENSGTDIVSNLKNPGYDYVSSIVADKDGNLLVSVYASTEEDMADAEGSASEEGGTEGEEPEEAEGTEEAGDEADMASSANISDLNYYYLYIDVQGNVKELDMGDQSGALSMSRTMKADQSGNFISANYYGQFYRIDPIDETVSELLEYEQFDEDFCILGNKLVMAGTDGGLIYDLDSGESTPADTAFQEVLNSFFGSGRDLSYSTGTKQYLLQEGAEENTYFLAYNQGLYRQAMGGEVMEQIIDGDLSTLGDPSYYLVGMAEMDNNEFIILYMGSGWSYRLIRYTYDETIATLPSQEIKVYSLRDNQTLRQAIISFQEKNPDSYVSLEVGISGEDGVTVSDALRTLNTEIMAGNGPDVIMLDGMPIDTYAEKGLLEDISSVIDNTYAGQIFENIAGAYETDGKTYAVATRFTFPVLFTSADEMKNISDLKGLADAAEKVRGGKESGGITSAYRPIDIAAFLYSACSPAWFNEDGTMDQEALTEFYTQVKKIYDAQIEGLSDDQLAEKEEEQSYLTDGTESAISDYMSIYFMSSFQEWISDTIDFTVNTVNDMDGYAYLISKIMTNSNISLNAFSGQSENVFTPQLIFGVSAKSEQKDAAVTFVESVMSKESQISSLGDGFPVNKEAYEEWKQVPSYVEDPEEPYSSFGFSSVDEDGNELSSYFFDAYWPKDEDFKLLDSMVEQLNTPASLDVTVMEAVLGQADACLRGNIEPAKAAENVLNDVNLYLSE